MIIGIVDREPRITVLCDAVIGPVGIGGKGEAHTGVPYRIYWTRNSLSSIADLLRGTTANLLSLIQKAELGGAAVTQRAVWTVEM
jgi:hypothetical protein